MNTSKTITAIGGNAKSLTEFLIILSAILSLALPVCSQTMNVTYKEISKDNKDMSYEIRATYPVVDFGPDALMGVRGIASDLNQGVEKVVEEMISEFEKNVSELENKSVNGNGSQLTIESNASVSGGSFFSAGITNFNYYSGAAHPMTTVTSYNYSTVAYGEIDSLSMLFKPGSGYLIHISDICINRLREYANAQSYDNIDDMILDGASAEEKNYRNWLIDGDNLKIIFNPYQAGPYVMGIQTVSIPLTELLSMIDPKGPLEYLFR